jgi:hypothetical protein
VERRDHATNLIAQLAGALSWHLPLTWMAIRRLRLAREMACDDWVLQHGAVGEDYASHLIAIVRALPRPVRAGQGALCMACEDMKERLRAILDGDRLRDALAPRSMLISVVLISAFTVPLSSMHLEERRMADPVAASRHADPGARIAAAQALGAQGGKASLQQLMVMLDDAELSVRLASLRALERRGERASFYDVLPHRNDVEPAARAATLSTLGAIGCEPAFIAIASTLSDPDPEVRRTAARILSRFEARLMSRSLRELYQAQHPKLKRDLNRTVGRPQDVSAVELLRASLSDSAPGVRQAAGATLDRFGVVLLDVAGKELPGA